MDRVSALETVVSLRKELREGQNLGLKIVYDALTGASGNGAVPSDVPQTFTGPSGGGSYSTPAGETPLDGTFKDTRVAASGTFEQSLGSDTRWTAGANFSTEYDYRSLGVSSSLARDFDKRNTTLSGGFSISWDTIDPVGGVPDPLAVMLAATGGGDDDRDDDEEEGEEGDAESKVIFDGLLSLTQIVNRSTVVMVAASVSHQSGYMTDPYKFVSIVDEAPGAGQGRPLEHRYERRPDRRTKKSLFAEAKHHFGHDMIDLSYRYLWDDWGVTSHTAELRYRWALPKGHVLQPHLRAYRQEAASFYHRFLTASDPLPTYASADYRLGKMDAVTLGLKYARPIGPSTVSVRVEGYKQLSRDNGDEAIGVLRDMDLYPAVDAVMVHLGFSRQW